MFMESRQFYEDSLIKCGEKSKLYRHGRVWNNNNRRNIKQHSKLVNTWKISDATLEDSDPMGNCCNTPDSEPSCQDNLPLPDMTDNEDDKKSKTTSKAISHFKYPNFYPSTPASDLTSDPTPLNSAADMPFERSQTFNCCQSPEVKSQNSLAIQEEPHWTTGEYPGNRKER